MSKKGEYYDIGREHERRRIIELIEKFEWYNGKPERMTQQFAKDTIIRLIEEEEE